MSCHKPIDRPEREQVPLGPASAEIAEMAGRAQHLAFDRAVLRAREDDRRRMLRGRQCAGRAWPAGES